MSQRLATILELVGLALMAVAGALVSPALGVAVAGLGCVVVGYINEGE